MDWNVNFIISKKGWWDSQEQNVIIKAVEKISHGVGGKILGMNFKMGWINQ